MRRWLAPALLLATACGGSAPLKPEELASELRQIKSLAAEAELLGEVERAGHTTASFAREHRRYLHEAASSKARKLARKTAPSELERQLRSAGALLDSVIRRTQ